MNRTSLYLVSLATVLMVGMNGAVAEPLRTDADGLVRIKSTRLEQVYLLPGADFSVYKKVLIAPAQVTFQKDWLRDMNRTASSLEQRISAREANRILTATCSGFDEIWADTFEAAGYELVTEPGADVLRVEPRVFDIYINAPDIITATPIKAYTVETGQASLGLEMRDSLSSKLLGSAIDQDTAGRDDGRLQSTTRVTNRREFRRMFTRWATLVATDLHGLAQTSRLPDQFRPIQ